MSHNFARATASGGLKALGATGRILAKTPLIGKGLSSETAAVAARTVTRAAESTAVNGAERYAAWKALPMTEKIYFDAGQTLTTRATNNVLKTFAGDVASTAVKGQYYLEGKGSLGAAGEWAKGAAELLKNTLTDSTAFTFKNWTRTGSTPSWQWFWPRALGFAASATGSYSTRANPEANKPPK